LALGATLVLGARRALSPDDARTPALRVSLRAATGRGLGTGRAAAAAVGEGSADAVGCAGRADGVEAAAFFFGEAMFDEATFGEATFGEATREGRSAGAGCA